MKHCCVDKNTQNLLTISDSSQAIVQISNYQSSILKYICIKKKKEITPNRLPMIWGNTVTRTIMRMIKMKMMNNDNINDGNEK